MVLTKTRKLIKKLFAEKKETARPLNNESTNIRKFQKLVKLRNFRSAEIIAVDLVFSELSFVAKLNVINCFLSGTQGVRADWLLESNYTELMEAAEGSSRFALKYCATIANCGLPYQVKIDAIEKIINIVKGGDQKHELDVRWIYYQTKSSGGEALDPREFIEDREPDSDSLPAFVKFLIQARSFGHDEFVQSSLENLRERFSISEPNVAKAYIICNPDYFLDINNGLKVSEIDLPYNLSLIPAILPLVSKSDFARDWFSKCAEHYVNIYVKLSVYEKNSVLRTFLYAEMHDLVLKLSEFDAESQQLMPIWIAKGFRYFENDDYRSANDCFLYALEQDPGDKTAAAGLRLTLTRVGFDPGEILNVRRRIGYGTKSNGRPGVRYLGSEYTLALLLTGDYLRGQYTTRDSKNWLELKNVYGPKFLNCESLLKCQEPERSSLFVIGDSGVGDEIRAAQFYSAISSRFRKVYVSCDPRLYNIFSLSFPEIDFIPVERFRRGVSERKLQSGGEPNNQRLVGFDEKVSNYLTEQCRQYLEGCDYITYSQNLYFNYFLGDLNRPEHAAYLRWPAQRTGPAEDGVLRVGLLWRSHFRSGSRKYMYLDIKDFGPLTGVQSLELFSIQHCIDPEEQLWCQSNNIKIFEDLDLFNDFEGACEVLQTLDLVIGISSVPVELAAALGVEVWMLGFSPENYFLRTAGGRDSHDRYTLNSSVIAPPWIDFSNPRSVCVEQVFEEVSRRLEIKLKGPVDEVFANELY
ncbi:MAG: hypothetical protein JJ867_00300 [Marinobacter sp.]|nr:hypothetical protein [Marinobacter sp.]